MQSIKKICVCGAGTMGSGIAQLCAVAGFSTLLFDVSEAMLEKSKTVIEDSLSKFVDKQKLTAEQKTSALQSLVFTNDITVCKADIVIEAIVEDMQAKVSLFKQLAAINDEDTIFATNTSSISVSVIARQTGIAERFAGLHFFNPAPLMKLVEVVRATATSEHVIQTLYSLSKQLGKTPVVCKDVPGFIVNRVARHYYLEALLLIENNVADIATIDTLMQSIGFKMGPFQLMDLIGIDVNYAVSDIVYNALGEPQRLKPSNLQKQKVDAKELGKKTGKGFYDYLQHPDDTQK